jgi:hypothetical protein
MVIDDLNDLYKAGTSFSDFHEDLDQVWPLIYAVLKAADEWADTYIGSMEMIMAEGELSTALCALDNYDEKERRSREADSG